VPIPDEPATACVAYDDIRQGSWSCRWGGWIILVRERPSGWDVVVWELPPGALMADRRLIAHDSEFGSAQAAVGHACDVLRAAGVVLLVSGTPQRLEKFLSFSPAPQATP
jgi:hypothetical protein